MNLTRILSLLVLAYAAAAQPRHVVLISLDGFAAFHMQNSELKLPNIRALADAGAWAEQGSETVFPSVTHPSHTTIITGVFPRKHGVLGNEMPMAGADRMAPGNSMLRSKVILTKTIDHFR